MKVIAVVGTASGSGKSRLACAIVRAFPGLGAVKISPREGPPRVEWGAGNSGKDTARFAASGAAVVARIVAPRGRVAEAWLGMRGELEGLPGVVVEGAGALSCPSERLTILVAAPGSLGKRPERDERLAAAADCILVVRTAPADGASGGSSIAGHRDGVPVVDVTEDEESWVREPLLTMINAFLDHPSTAWSNGKNRA